jgi:ATP-binding cassette subfamily F protein uup
LLKLCLDQIQPSEGTAVLGKRVKVNYIDQTRMVLDGTGSLLDEVADGNEKLHFGDQLLGARAYLRRFLFADDRINERVDLLSGGERARLMLAKVLKTGGNLIVLDEPTNDLDRPSLRMLEEALADFPGSVLVVSHDRYFLDRVCDQVIAFEDSGVHITPGNYSYYLEKRQQRENAERIQAVAAARDAEARRKAAQPQAAKPRKLKMAERKELEGMEEQIMEAEATVEALESKLNDPAFQAENFSEVPQVAADLEAAKASAAKLYTRWEYLEKMANAT